MPFGQHVKNFYMNFECYDLTNDITTTPYIWCNTPTSNQVQNPMVESTKNALKMDSYLHS